MTVARRSPSFWPRRASLFAAFLALVLQLMFPAGFMAAEPGQAHGFPIVICSAYGQTVVDWNGPAVTGDHQKAPAKKGMASCPFAGHAVGSNAPAPVVIAVPVAFFAAVAPARAYAVSPGLGLAAPPPPAIGPPAAA